MGRNKLSKVSVFLGLFVLVVGANVFVLVKQRKKEGGDDNSQRVLGSMTGNKTQAKSHRARLRNTRTGLANADRRRNTHTKKKILYIWPVVRDYSAAALRNLPTQTMTVSLMYYFGRTCDRSFYSSVIELNTENVLAILYK